MGLHEAGLEDYMLNGLPHVQFVVFVLEEERF